MHFEYTVFNLLVSSRGVRVNLRTFRRISLGIIYSSDNPFQNTIQDCFCNHLSIIIFPAQNISPTHTFPGQFHPTFTADPRRGIVLSFCVQGCFYAFTNNSGRMDESKLVALLGAIAKAAQKIEL